MESFGYATEMNPKLKGKKTPLLPPEPTEEYIPPAFNASEVRSLNSHPSMLPPHASITLSQCFPLGRLSRHAIIVAMTVWCLAVRLAAEPAG